jgi:hypothetical protein
MAILGRRDWAAVAATSTHARRGAPVPERGPDLAAAALPVARNSRYVSPTAGLDRARTSPRFIAASVEAWRQKMRGDDAVRAALLNGPRRPCQG